jgi:hypothetical protein
MRSLRTARPVARASFYQKLMSVSFRNTFYPAPFECPDLAAGPTLATAELMSDLGLLYRETATGFVIAWDARRSAELIAALRRRVESDGESWTRLSFVLWLRNPLFVNFSEIPLGTAPPGARNFFFTNQEAHDAGRRGVLLNRGRFAGAGQLFDVIPSQIRIPLSAEVVEVRLLALSGASVLTVPHLAPGPVYLDLGPLPLDRYTLQEIGAGGVVLRQGPVLYTAATPVPFGFIDLLLARPSASADGVYPIDLGASPPEIGSVDYQLAFARRSTLWRYWVVLPRKRLLTGLRIESDPAGVAKFRGPSPAKLPDGTPAVLFTARKPIPLQARPDFHFVLHSDAGTLLDPLPSASVRQVLPEVAPSPHGAPATAVYSDIYAYV